MGIGSSLRSTAARTVAGHRHRDRIASLPMSAIIGRTIQRAVRRRTRLRSVAWLCALLAVACATAHESAKPAATAVVAPSLEPQPAAPTEPEATSMTAAIGPTGAEPEASVPGLEASQSELESSEPDSLSELGVAAFMGDGRKVDALLAGGADVNRRERLGATALTLALGNSQDEPKCCEHAERQRLAQMMVRAQRKLRIARTLVEHGADVTGSDRLDLTPLHYAVMAHGREPDVIAIMELLIAHGADVNRRTQPYGRSPLEWAIEGSPERVACLLRHGADPSIVTHEGKTLLEVAEARGNASIVEQLKLALAERARK
jgi:Ankyrin repeats (3 copies)